MTILEDAKPEQVQAVQSFACQKSGGINDRNSTMLEFEGKSTKVWIRIPDILALGIQIPIPFEYQIYAIVLWLENNNFELTCK